MNGRPRLSALIVEDSKSHGETLQQILRSDYPALTLHHVGNGSMLNEVLAHGGWDAIICGHNPPQLDAVALLHTARKKYADIPFVIVSDMMGEAAAIGAMMAGAADAIHRDHLPRLLPVLHREIGNSTMIRQSRQAEEQARRIAYYDGLTGLPNQAWLSERLDALTGRDATSSMATLLLLNISNFLSIPRALGLEVASQVLKNVAQRLCDCIGDDGDVARLGGDRFAILLPNADEYRVVARLQALGDCLFDAVHVARQELFLTFNLGGSVFPRDGCTLHELLNNAETAMSQGKASGRFNYHFFDRGINAGEQEMMVMGHALHRAVRQGEFYLQYQPQFSLASGAMFGTEALLRWRQPGGRVVEPDKFIPLLEKSGLIVQVGEWVLRSACEQNRKWQQAGLPPIRVAVNLSATQFQQAELVPMVRRVLRQTGLDPNCLELEITENIAMYNEEAVIAKLSELSNMGVSLAIDDFGTGYSSLSYLRHFPIHRLKIDRTFIGDIGMGEKDGALVRTIISLARNLGVAVVAEGVETERQKSFLLSCDCDEVQGYLFSPPVSAPIIEDILAGNGKP
ncbi:MAG: EAL domain-containing protein [Sideroxydans sp.]|nr:EAL domain-containing protein [Sideroxydans sp.]